MRRQTNILAILFIAVVLIGGVALSGCTTGSMNVSPTPAPTENPTAAAIATPTPEATVTVTAAPSATPTATPTASPTANQAYSIPQWVDYSSGNITNVPTVMTTFTSVAPGTYPYNGEIPPWVDYKIQTPAPPVLVTVTGNVEKPLALTMPNLQNDYAIKHIHVSYTKKGVTTVIDCDGASLNSILNAAGIKSGASTIQFTSSDAPPYIKSISIDAIRADSSAVIAFTDQGLRIVIPSQATSYWVSNIANIQVI